MSKKSIYFLASKEKIEFLKQLESNTNPDVPSVKFLQRDECDNDKKNFEKIQELLKGETLGIFAKDQDFPGAVMEGFKKILDKFDIEDMSNPLAYIMAPKAESEVLLDKEACQRIKNIYRDYLIEEIFEIVDKYKNIKHSQISEGIKHAISDNDDNKVYLCYPAIIKSGGNYQLNLNLMKESDEETVHLGANAIICAVVLMESDLDHIVLTSPDSVSI